MGKKNLGEKIHYVPLVASIQKSADFYTAGINMGLFNQVDFICQLGALGGAADFTVKVEECTASAGTSNDALAAEYRLSAAAGTDTMGAVTALETSGLALANASDGGKCLIVTVDSDSLTDTHKYARLYFTRGGAATAYIGVMAACYPRYEQKTPSLALT